MARGRPKKKADVPVEEVPVEEVPVEEIIVTKEVSEDDKKEILNVISGSDEIPDISLPLKEDVPVDVTYIELGEENSEEVAQIKDEIRKACIRTLADNDVPINMSVMPDSIPTVDFAQTITRVTEINARMDYIKSEIDYCNAQIWADNDNCQGKIFSMYRKELATYLVRLYECYDDASIELPNGLPAKVRGY